MLAPISVPVEWLDQDVAAVHRAAGLLQIPEFAFFRLAYQRWHGRGAHDRDLEPVFISYLFRRRVPPWVRHLAREVQDRSATVPWPAAKTSSVSSSASRVESTPLTSVSRTAVPIPGAAASWRQGASDSPSPRTRYPGTGPRSRRSPCAARTRAPEC